jgi:hypothetical protein
VDSRATRLWTVPTTGGVLSTEVGSLVSKRSAYTVLLIISFVFIEGVLDSVGIVPDPLEKWAGVVLAGVAVGVIVAALAGND